MSDPLTIIHGDALSSLGQLPDESVQCVVTSPPYWGLRDYGVDPIVWDNHNGCEHLWESHLQPSANGQTTHAMIAETLNESSATRKPKLSEFCQICGAWAGSLGLEPTPELYVSHVVQIFRELKRVLRRDGTLWLNLGDSYFGGISAGGQPKDSNGADKARQQKSVEKTCPQCGADFVGYPRQRFCSDYCGGKDNTPRQVKFGMKAKDLVGIPWMVAFALRADGWYLRSDIIWSKPNPMPESVTDRPTRSHEHLFLLGKSQRYYYNADAIAEPLDRPEEGDRKTPARFGGADKWPEAQKQSRLHSGNEYLGTPNGTRNRRSVWTIATTPFPQAHFATFPTEIPRLCILAGSSAMRRRCDCDEVIDTPCGDGPTDDPTLQTGRAGMNRPRRPDEGTRSITRREQRDYAGQMKRSPYRAEMATQASEAFAHYIRTDRSGARPLPEALLRDWLQRGWLVEPEPCTHPSEPDTILDPFAGSGTTGKVAIELGRKAILIEPKAEYVEMIKRRCQTTIGLPLTFTT